ncbi:flagellar hook capping FlgD N-terminal domain-containing protein [Paracoccus lutimaris]|uniref:Basal-body rod modification protein FlgD n=1 Tax=Paracoccus lutimaris TaxID=1490030 RepID=A0A368YRJ5_9RHOB|nr:flagellar hook capping FlgD N-terminal domain-containing protein [Paracoccus lutimaris]RCW80764.1 flagellar basal-body rod modification protein FlgD [Paracoccus lutimaris]
MVDNVSATSSMATTARQASGASTSGSAFASSDFETFLKMLTTQIKNQDPLNPMEGTEFAVQLATFSGVEQQVQTNALLQQLLSGGTNGLGELSGWIGRDVRTTAPVWFDRSPLTMTVNPAAGADTVTLITLDARGNEVSREEIGAGSGEIDWQGRDAQGNVLPAGIYQFRVVSAKDGEVINTSDVGVYTRVTGAELVGGTPRLILTGGATAELEDISAVRE